MRKARYQWLVVMLCVLSTQALAQEQPANENPDYKENKNAPRELAIPTSPLFDLLGAAPSQVARTADIKNFKVDWSFRNWRLNPNLAIQAQPIWELFYNRKNLQKYQSANRFQRALASLDVSMGTIAGENNERRIGGAVKINLFKQRDPLLRRGEYDDISKAFDEELILLKATEKQILSELDTVVRPTDLIKKREALRENDGKLASFYSRRNAAIQERAGQYLADNWNAGYLDFAFGKVYSYNTDSVGSLRKLSLNRNTGNALWLNFGFGAGKRGLISGLIRTSFYEEQLTFSLRDEATGIDSTATAIAANKLFTLGLNFRYGGPVFNFFAEIIREQKATKTALASLNDVFSAPAGTAVVSSTVKWDVVHPYVINFGGDWRISRNVILNYGMRWTLDKNLKSVSFLPIANIACMMR